jgi:hypothetical protein
MSMQKPQPLIWLARIFTRSRVAAGRAESKTPLFAETRHFDDLDADGVVGQV